MTAEITERLVAEEEQQPVSEVEQTNAFVPKKRMPQVRNPGRMGKQEEGAICERFIQFNIGEAM